MKILLPLLSVVCLFTSIAQVPKQIIVEHFTNTKCGICAQKNPTLFTNLNNNPDILHVAYHPSSPYNTCVLNLHNVTGNDNRTNQYGIYGATPRIVIQGEVQNPSINFSSATLFDNYRNQISPISISINVDKTIQDSIKMDVSVTLESSLGALGNSQTLYVALAEDTLFYNAPNGENIHHNVFRLAINGNQGTAILLPTTIGDSVISTFTVAKNINWDINRIFAYAILQETANKNVIQSKSSAFENTFSLSTTEQLETADFDYFLDGFLNHIDINTTGNKKYDQIMITSLDGKIIHHSNFYSNTKSIDLTAYQSGLYIVTLSSSTTNESKSKKFIKTW